MFPEQIELRQGYRDYHKHTISPSTLTLSERCEGASALYRMGVKPKYAKGTKSRMYKGILFEETVMGRPFGREDMEYYQWATRSGDRDVVERIIYLGEFCRKFFVLDDDYKSDWKITYDNEAIRISIVIDYFGKIDLRELNDDLYGTFVVDFKLTEDALQTWGGLTDDGIGWKVFQIPIYCLIIALQTATPEGINIFQKAMRRIADGNVGMDELRGYASKFAKEAEIYDGMYLIAEDKGATYTVDLDSDEKIYNFTPNVIPYPIWIKKDPVGLFFLMRQMLQKHVIWATIQDEIENFLVSGDKKGKLSAIKHLTPSIFKCDGHMQKGMNRGRCPFIDACPVGRDHLFNQHLEGYSLTQLITNIGL